MTFHIFTVSTIITGFLLENRKYPFHIVLFRTDNNIQPFSGKIHIRFINICRIIIQLQHQAFLPILPLIQDENWYVMIMLIPDYLAIHDIFSFHCSHPCYPSRLSALPWPTNRIISVSI